MIDYEKEDFAAGDRRYDLVLDAKMTRSPFACARVLDPGGTYVAVGGEMLRLLQAALAGGFIARRHGKRVRVVALKPNKDLAAVNALFEQGALRPVLEPVLPLEALPEGFRLFARGDHKGKIVVTVQ